MRIMLVGDISCGEHYFCFGHGPRSAVERGRDLFAGVRQVLGDADLVIGNLEGPLSDLGLVPSDPLSRGFRGSPRTVAQLRDAGITVVSVANNHALQHGVACFEDTVAQLRRAGIAVAGLGPALQEVVVEPRPGERLIVLAASEVPDAYLPQQRHYAVLDRDGMRAAVRDAAAAGGAVVAYLHWGLEGPLARTPDQADYARQLVAAGASLVVGHHSHVLNAIERVGPGIAAYSLGDFVFDLPWDHRLRRSAILDVTLGADGAIARAQVWPVRLAGDGRPVGDGAAVPLASATLDWYPAGGRLTHQPLRKLAYFLLNLGRGKPG